MGSLDFALWQVGILLLSISLSSELLLLLPLRRNVQHLNKLLRRIFKTLHSSRISDHWKEQVIIVYANRLLRYSLLLPALILFSMLPLITGFWFITDSAETLLTVSLDPLILLGVTTVSMLYLFLRTRWNG